MKIRILASASRDLMDGYRFYEMQSAGVGATLDQEQVELNMVEKTFGSPIGRDPHAGQWNEDEKLNRN
jgi:hypothetical protein